MGARAPFSAKKVTDGALVLDNLVRVRGVDKEQLNAVIHWAVADSFWSPNLRSLASLTKVGGNGETKYANILTAMAKELP